MHLTKFKILFLLLISTSFSLYSQKISYKEYIQKNIKIFDEKQSEMFDKSDNFRLFVTGEYHYRKENSEIYLKVLNNLYKNEEVRIVFMEGSMAQGMLVQHYLETGNKNSLSKISTSGQFPESHYKKLKAFYDDLPENDKFKIFGIDVDIYDINSNFVSAVNILFEDKDMPKKLNSLLNRLSSISYLEDTKTKYLFNEIYKDFETNSKFYDKLLNDNYNIYKSLLNRGEKSLNFGYYNYNRGKDSIPHTLREEFIYNNILQIIDNNPDCNYFGQFGLAHIGLTHFLLIPEEDNVESFITKLNNRDFSPVKGKVCSTAILYYDTNTSSFDFSTNKFLYALSQLLYQNSLKKNFPSKAYKLIKKNTEKDKIYFLKLNDLNSPFINIAERKFQNIIIKT